MVDSRCSIITKIISLMSSLNSIIQKSGSVNSRNGVYSPYRSTPTVLSVNKMGSHLKSTLPQLHQRSGKKIITILSHDSIGKERGRLPNVNELFELLNEVYESEINFIYFKEYKQLLRYQYVKDELYCILISEQLLDNCRQFVQMESKTVSNRAKMLVLCVFQNQNKFKEQQKLYEKRKDKQPALIFHFRAEDSSYPSNVIKIIDFHLRNLVVSEKRIVRRWASNNVTDRTRCKERKIHFFCEKVVFEILGGYKAKPNFPKIEVDQFHVLQDVLVLNNNTRISQYDSLQANRQSTFRQSQITETQSIYFPLLQSDIKQKVALTRTNGRMSEDESVCLKIIICHSYHDQIKKIRAFVNTQKNDWLLWEISEAASDVIGKLEQFFDKKEVIEAEQSIIESVVKRDEQISLLLQKKQSKNSGQVKDQSKNQWDILTDQKIYIFRNEKDWTSTSMLKVVQEQLQTCEERKFVAANYIIFKDLGVIEEVIRFQSSVNKYYIVLNEQLNNCVKQKILNIVNKQYFKKHYIKILYVKPEGSSFKSSYEKVARSICQRKVRQAVFQSIMPFVIIDQSTADYYYFLDKYSSTFKKINFKQINCKEELINIIGELFQQKQLQKQNIQYQNKKIVIQQERIFVIVKDLQSMNTYINFCKNSIHYDKLNFILEQQNSEKIELNQKVLFRGFGRFDIQIFLQNMFRRESHLFFQNSIGRKGQISLVIFNNSIEEQISIQKSELKKWELMKCKIYQIKDYIQLQSCLLKQKDCFVYIVHSYAEKQKMSQICETYSNVKRIVNVGSYNGYNFRFLDEKKIVSDVNQIFFGISSFQMTVFLKNLRFMIKSPPKYLRKSIRNVFIFVYIQKEYILSEEVIKKLKKRNDSLIIKCNGFQIKQLPSLLQQAEKQQNFNIFIGDQFIGESVCNHNNKYKQNFRFITIKISEAISVNNSFCLLETTEMEECVMLLMNLPENRYKVISQIAQKTNIYVGSQQKQVQPFYQQLKLIKERLPEGILQIFQYKNIESLKPVLSENNFILVHRKNQEQWSKYNMDSAFLFFVVNQQEQIQPLLSKNKRVVFEIKKHSEFKNFFNQLAYCFNPQIKVQPIKLITGNQQNILNFWQNFTSQEIPKKMINVKFNLPFKPKKECNNLMPVQFEPMLDLQIPTLISKQQCRPDLSIPRVLGFDILNQIKQKAAKYTVLYPSIDTNRSVFGPSFGSKDDFLSFMPLPLPTPPKTTLAILYPDSPEFAAICEILRKDLQKGPYEISMIQFSSKQKLQDFSKNNCEKLQVYKKIVLFLSASYKKYAQYLNSLQVKLNSRLEYFILNDSFCNASHSRLRQHLPGYKISSYELPFERKMLPKYFYLVGFYIILVPVLLRSDYQHLGNCFVRIVQYKSIEQVRNYLPTKNTFVIVVSNKQDYHQLKFEVKDSPSSSLMVDGVTSLALDQFHLFKVSVYAMYYGSNGVDYLKRILPLKPAQSPLKSKYLYYRKEEADYIGDVKYVDYQKKEYSCWDELYHFLVVMLRGESSWLLRVFNQAHTAVSLQPMVYMEKHLYMKEFKYFSEQSHDSALAFWDLPETYYQSELSLASKLQSEEAPSIVLYNKNNEKWIGNLKLKHNDRFKWFCVEDEGWIDEEGNLNNGTDMLKLLTKVKLFNLFFDGRTLSSYNRSVYFLLASTSQYLVTFSKTAKIGQKQLAIKSQKEIIDYFQMHPYMMVVVFIQVAKQFPLVLLGIEREAKGRLKLINVKNSFVDDSVKLFVKYTEIVPVIKNLQRIQKSGKKVFVVCQAGEGKAKVKGLWSEKNLVQVQQKQYRNIRPDLQMLAAGIRGIYKRVFVICFEDEKKDIDILFNSYGIVQQCVQYLLLKRNKSKKVEDPQVQDEAKAHCSCDNRDENQLAIESGPHSCIKQSEGGQTPQTGQQVCRGNLPIESSEHLEGKKIRMLNIDDYSSILMVYQGSLQVQFKKELLVACSKNDKIRPILYNSVSELKVLKEESKTLMLLMMKEIPMELFTELVEKQRQSIVFTTTLVKAIVPKYTDIVLSSVTSLFELAGSAAIKRLKVEQVNRYLKRREEGSASSTPQLSVIEQEYGLQKSGSTIKLNLLSGMEEEMGRLRKSLNGNLLVMLVDFGKRNKFTILAVKYHFLIQSYAGDVILENEIKSRNRHSILCVVNRMMLSKLEGLKEKYPYVYFFLQHNKAGEVVEGKERRLLAGQFWKESEFQKILADLSKQNEKIMESNPESAVLFNSDIKGRNNNSPNRTNFHYQSMINVEGRKMKVTSAAVTNRLACTQPVQDLSAKKGSTKTKGKGERVGRGVRNNEYYQN